MERRSIRDSRYRAKSRISLRSSGLRLPASRSRKSQRHSPPAPSCRLVCAAAGVNDCGAGHWNQYQFPGIVDAGGTEEPASLVQGLEAKGKMRSLLTAITAMALFASGAAQAKVAITVDKDNQQMTVAVDGVERYRWPVSSGIPSYETPNGSFRAFRMEEDHYSKEFDDAPMPHSIFFTKIGHAIH